MSLDLFWTYYNQSKMRFEKVWNCPRNCFSQVYNGEITLDTKLKIVLLFKNNTSKLNYERIICILHGHHKSILELDKWKSGIISNF